MSSALSCPDCGTPHAVDQRYCVECGHRLRPLPATVANALAAMAGDRRVGADRLNRTPGPTGGASTPTRPGLMLFGSPLELPSPRAMAVAVLAVLAFGVIISSGNFSLASSPLLLNVQRALSAAVPASAAAPSTGASGSNSAPAATSGSTASGSSGSTGGSSGGSASTTSSGTSTTTPASSSSGLPPIKHVWVIELGDQGYASTFDRGSPDTYLSTTLASQGQVVPMVYASATSDLANEVGLVSGQGPTVQTEANCPKYTALTPGTLADRQVKGNGCVYPKSTTSLLSELTAAHDTWKAYVQGLGTTAATGCKHPGLGATDPNFSATGADSYVTWRNPIVYLAGLTSQKSCGSDDTGLAALTTDLKTAAATPNVSLIFPNTCDDGSDTPCHPGAAAGTTQSDAFLKSIVPQIMASPAYKQNGMILITFAQAPQNVPTPDQSSCCNQPTQYPNLPSANYEPPANTTTGTGTTTTGTGTASSTTDTTTTDVTTTETIGSPTVTTVTSPSNPYTEDTVTVPPTTTTVTTPVTTAVTTPVTTETGVTTTCVPTTSTTTGTDTTTTGTGTTGTDTTGTDTTTTGTATTTDDTCVCPSTTDTTTTGTDTTPTSSTAATTTTGTDTTGTTSTTATTPDSNCEPTPTSTTGTTGGGGQVGMLVLSQYVTKNLQDGEDMFNTFSITGSIEQLFGLKYTGYAATAGLPLFSGFFYSNYSG